MLMAFAISVERHLLIPPQQYGEMEHEKNGTEASRCVFVRACECELEDIVSQSIYGLGELTNMS